MTYTEGQALQLSDELTWQHNQIVLRRKYSHLPGGFSSGESFQEAVSSWMQLVRKHQDERSYHLTWYDAVAAADFIGRKAELDHIHAVLSAAPHSKILLYGISGIGKTSLARQYAGLHRHAYDGVLFLTCGSSFLRSVADDHILSIQNLTFTPEVYASDRIYFNKKWSVFSELLSRGNYLLLLDNLPPCTAAEWRKISALPCDVILTGREISEHWEREALQIFPFSTDTEWMQFYRIFSTDVLSPARTQALNTWQKTVSGNTMLMKIALTNPDLSVTDVKTYDDYFLQAGELSSSTLRTLQALALLGAEGMRAKDFQAASGVSARQLRHLANRCFVQLQRMQQIDYCSLHPLIREIIWRKFPPSAMSCRRFLEKLGSRYASIWNRPFDEVRSALPVCRSILNAWPSPEPLLSNAFDAFITVLWIGGHFREAEGHALQLFRACEETYGAHHQQTGRMALRVAAVYHNSMRFPPAFRWYQKAYDILTLSPHDNAEYHFLLMQAADKLSRHYRHNDAFTQATDFWCIAEEAWTRYAALCPNRDSEHQKTYFLHCLGKAKILYHKGDLSAASTLCRKIIQEHEALYGTANYTHVEMTLALSQILLAEGFSGEAEEKAAYCLEKAIVYRGGEIAKETLGIKELLADIWRANGEMNRAFTMYSEILSSLRLHYPLQETWYRTIQEKQRNLLCR